MCRFVNWRRALRPVAWCYARGRQVYETRDNELIVVVVKVGHRRDVYKRL